MTKKKKILNFFNVLLAIIVMLIKSFFIVNLFVHVFCLSYIIINIDEYHLILKYIDNEKYRYAIFYSSILLHLFINVISLFLLTGYLIINRFKFLFIFIILFLVFFIGIKNSYLLYNDVSVLSNYSNNWIILTSVDNEVLSTVPTVNETVGTVESNSNYIKKTLVSIGLVAFIVFIGWNAGLPYVNTVKSIFTTSSNSNIMNESVNNIGNLPIPVPVLSQIEHIETSATPAEDVDGSIETSATLAEEVDGSHIETSVIPADEVDVTQVEPSATPADEVDSVNLSGKEQCSHQSTILDGDGTTVLDLDNACSKQATMVDLEDVDIITLDEGNTHLIVDNSNLLELIDVQHQDKLFSLLDLIKSWSLHMDQEQALFDMIYDQYNRLSHGEKEEFLNKVLDFLNNYTSLYRFTAHISTYTEQYVDADTFVKDSSPEDVLNDVDFIISLRSLLRNLVEELNAVREVLLQNPQINPDLIRSTDDIIEKMQSLLDSPEYDISYYQQVCDVMLIYTSFPLSCSNYLCNIVINDLLLNSLGINIYTLRVFENANTQNDILDITTDGSRIIKCYCKLIELLFNFL